MRNHMSWIQRRLGLTVGILMVSRQRLTRLLLLLLLLLLMTSYLLKMMHHTWRNRARSVIYKISGLGLLTQNCFLYDSLSGNFLHIRWNHVLRISCCQKLLSQLQFIFVVSKSEKFQGSGVKTR